MPNSEESNRFELCIAVAKRARQIQEGAVPLVQVAKNNNNPLLIAYQEFKEKKLQIVQNDELRDAHQEEIDDFEAMIESNDANIEKAVEEAVAAEEPKKKKKKA